MKKVFLLSCILLFLGSCKTQKAVTISLEDQLAILDMRFTLDAKVVQVDSTEHYYLIFIEGDDKYFKVVSERVPPKQYVTTPIEIEKTYTFNVQQITDRRRSGEVTINGKNYATIGCAIQTCESFEKAQVCTQMPYKLAISSNVNGLYISN